MDQTARLTGAPRHFDNPLDTLLGYQLRRASAVVLADFGRALEEISLKPTEASVLLLIGSNPGMTQSEIGRILGIKRANMAPIAAILTTRHLIERSRPDGRAQGLKLSADGLILAADVRSRMDRHEAGFLPNLSSNERTALTDLIRRIWSA